jgi:hypothetical protein
MLNWFTTASTLFIFTPLLFQKKWQTSNSHHDNRAGLMQAMKG